MKSITVLKNNGVQLEFNINEEKIVIQVHHIIDDTICMTIHSKDNEDSALSEQAGQILLFGTNLKIQSEHGSATLNLL